MPNKKKIVIKKPAAKAATNARRKRQRNKIVNAPVATSQLQCSTAPRMSVGKQGQMRSCRIAHSELVATVNGSIAFTATSYACNPGIAATFPWLSTQAVSWEQYRFNALRFRYVTRTGTTTVGSVLMAPDYDALDAPPATETGMSAYQGCTEDAPWREISMTLDIPSMFAIGPRKYVRTYAVSSDLKTYDAASFYLATVAQTGADPIGKLWVDYDVTFYIPQVVSPTLLPTRTSMYSLTANTNEVSGVAFNTPFDTTQYDAFVIGTPAAGVFTPPRGVYLVTAVITARSTLAARITNVVQIFKNGAALANPVAGSAIQDCAVGNQDVPVAVTAAVVCSGTDTVAVNGTITTTAGVPSIRGTSAWVIFRLA